MSPWFLHGIIAEPSSRLTYKTPICFVSIICSMIGSSESDVKWKPYSVVY